VKKVGSKKGGLVAAGIRTLYFEPSLSGAAHLQRVEKGGRETSRPGTRTLGMMRRSSGSLRFLKSVAAELNVLVKTISNSRGGAAIYKETLISPN
jgi:hypothetical protein